MPLQKYPLVRFLSGLFLACFAANAIAATPVNEAEFHQQLRALYNFEPHKLDQATINEKSKLLDAFWTFVKSDTDTTLPLLRKELDTSSHAAFFYYDGSKLLLSLSDNREDQQLALRAIPKADLSGIQPTDYLRTVHGLASKGLDTREAALRILDFPDFSAFIPQHALTLGQNYSLIYMLFPLDESLFVEDLAKRLRTEQNNRSRQSLLLALWYTVTPEGNKAISEFVNDENASADARAYGKKLLERRGSGAATATDSISAGSIRNARRMMMRRPISDEALIEFDRLTAELLAQI